MASPASEGALGELHVIVAEALKEMVQDKEHRTAADVNAAIKFLQNNNIQATRESNKALGELEDTLKAAADADQAGSAELQAVLDNLVQFPGSVAYGS